MEYKLWVVEEGKIEDVPYKVSQKENFMVDKSMGNYHLMPEDLKRAEAISDKLGVLKKELEKQLEEKQINYVKGRGKSLRHNPRITTFQEDNFENARNIFSYLCVTLQSNPNRKYELTCFRFCKRENTIECILKSIQYETSVNIISSDIYPESLEDGAESSSKDIDKFQYYFNPNVKFDNDEKIIIEDFINYIERNEKRIK